MITACHEIFKNVFILTQTTKTMNGQKRNLSSDFVFNPICGQCPPSGESFK